MLRLFPLIFPIKLGHSLLEHFKAFFRENSEISMIKEHTFLISKLQYFLTL